MKKLLSFILAVVLMVTSAGCSNAEARWQEQYDLGIKFVNEAKYEEAILSFTKALEIDPKQPVVYIRLADAYIAAGNNRGAVDILLKGYEETQSADISAKLDSVTGASPDENTGSEDIPYAEPLEVFEGRQEYVEFSRLPAEVQAATVDLTDIVFSGQTPDLQNSDIFTALKAVNSEGRYFVYTTWDKYRVSIEVWNNYYNIEMRPENGMGYYASANFDTDGSGNYGSYWATCNCVNWQFNGLMDSMKYWASGDQNGTESCTGPVVNNARHGVHEFSLIYNGDNGFTTETYEYGTLVESEEEYMIGTWRGIADTYIGGADNGEYIYSYEYENSIW